MKQHKKLIILSILLVLCLSMAGCAYSANFDTNTPLKEQRAKHAVWKELEKRDTIIYNDTEYRLLKHTDNMTLGYLPTRQLVLTAPNVPVLLREFFGDRVQVSEDGRFILDDYSYGYSYYCRADLYEELQARLDKEFVPEQYGYPYYGETSVDHFFTIDTADMNVIFDLLKTVEPLKIDDFPKEESFASPSDLELYGERGFEDETVIYGTSADLLQQKREMYVFSKAGAYYLTVDTVNIYPVPAEHTKMLDALCAKANYWK